MTFGGPCVGGAASGIVVSGVESHRRSDDRVTGGRSRGSERVARCRLLDSLFPTYERRGVAADRLALTKPAELKQ
jgi:hypothetical protein